MDFTAAEKALYRTHMSGRFLLEPSPLPAEARRIEPKEGAQNELWLIDGQEKYKMGAIRK